MKVLAVVAARRGSKRLPDKNVQLLGEKPLVMWTVDRALSLPEISDVLVSTDDVRIAEMARFAGAMVPWLRPTALATDDATSVDVVLHALNWYEQEKGAVDGVLLLQPTSPFRSRKTIEDAIRMLSEADASGIVSVSPTKSHPAWSFVVEDGVLHPYAIRGSEMVPTRHQDLPDVYALNGAIYLTSPLRLKRERTFLVRGVKALIMSDPVESLDIDTQFDLFVARCLLSHPGN